MECPQYSIRLEALGYLCDCLSARVQRWQVVKVIWHKAHRRRIDGWFNVIRQNVIISITGSVVQMKFYVISKLTDGDKERWYLAPDWKRENSGFAKYFLLTYGCYWCHEKLTLSTHLSSASVNTPQTQLYIRCPEGFWKWGRKPYGFSLLHITPKADKPKGKGRTDENFKVSK